MSKEDEPCTIDLPLHLGHIAQELSRDHPSNVRVHAPFFTPGGLLRLKVEFLGEQRENLKGYALTLQAQATPEETPQAEPINQQPKTDNPICLRRRYSDILEEAWGDEP